MKNFSNFVVGCCLGLMLLTTLILLAAQSSGARIFVYQGF